MFLNLLLQISTGAEDLTAEGVEEIVPHKETLSVIDLIVSGGWYIMIPLAVLSVVAIYIFIERFLAIQKASKEDPQFMNQIKDFIHEGKIDAANHLCKQTDSTFARMIQKGVKRIGKPLGDISAAIENVGKLELFKLEQSLSTLATIAGAAPMIGFLGTVIGMIVVFHEMRISSSGIEIEQLSGGIMQAMVTTVAGLVIGIIAYIAYNILVARVEKVVYKMEATTIEFMDLLQEPAE
ncbi:MotA/TolQ/ExbB proton channel family protein [Salibacteraceae bacterium]|jgi:biopolymer transport protein ExbB|nr:MotA/TolQ/ExbB proton channel family protein [Salibacteraceae bacterium]MDC1303838.1 MotA/TolQ/ExbB proton channel family protein [Salibacteraceae bacterium]